MRAANILHAMQINGKPSACVESKIFNYFLGNKKNAYIYRYDCLPLMTKQAPAFRGLFVLPAFYQAEVV
jgi:hypothetical protein